MTCRGRAARDHAIHCSAAQGLRAFRDDVKGADGGCFVDVVSDGVGVEISLEARRMMGP
jgi:hypothetical protein